MALDSFKSAVKNMKGELEYRNSMSTANLPVVDDPEKAFADITRQDYEDYIQDYRGFEESLIDKAQNDTSLIDRAPEDAAKQSEIARGVQDRNISRYGGAGLSVAQRQQQQVANQRQGQLGLAAGLNTARTAQRDINQSTLADLINIGQGVNRSSLSSMGTASQNAAAKASAYKNAKASHTSQMIGMGSSLAATAIMAFAI
jgi:hypothetical protein|tara:strand:- start:6668 stop:7270 length:603 start_codon:yes stop_codon:yes gene_type:complete